MSLNERIKTKQNSFIITGLTLKIDRGKEISIYPLFKLGNIF